MQKRSEMSRPLRDKSTARLLGCGLLLHQNVNVCIVDPESETSLVEDVVGEIWVDSPSKAMGYFGNAELIKSKFHAVLAHDAKPPSKINFSPNAVPLGI